MDANLIWSDVDSAIGTVAFQAEDLVGLTVRNHAEFDDDWDDDNEEGWDEEGQEDEEVEEDEDDEDDDEDWDEEDDDSPA
jgi:hypothetical protein